MAGALTLALLVAVAPACARTSLPNGAASQAEGSQLIADGTKGAATDAGTGAATDAEAATDAGTAVTTAGGTGAAPGAKSGAATGAKSGASGGGTKAASAGGSGSTVGVTDDSVKLGFQAPFSGPYAALGEAGYGYAQDWAAEINGKGGINGRKVILDKIDDQYPSPSGAIAACKQMQADGVFMAVTSVPEAGTDCEAKAGIPTEQVQTTEAPPDSPYILVPSNLVQVSRVFASFLKSTHMKAGSKRIGAIYLSDDSSSGNYFKAWQATAPKEGLTLGKNEVGTTNQSSWVPELSRMKSDGVEVIVAMVVLEGAQIVSQAHAIGYNPQFLFVYAAGNDQESTVARDTFNGIYAMRGWITEEQPAFKQWVERIRKYGAAGHAESANSLDAQFWAQTDKVGAMIRAAGRNLTRESVLAAARNMNYDNGLIPAWNMAGKPPYAPAQTALVPMVCCNPDWTWKSVGPMADSFPAA